MEMKQISHEAQEPDQLQGTIRQELIGSAFRIPQAERISVCNFSICVPFHIHGN
jgi:hypothetical protein